MKTINFTVEKCLKSLLVKNKKQTIRPFPKDGKPRFEVENPVKFLWNQRSKDKYFCPKCGKSVEHSELAYCNNCYSTIRPFNKILGFGIITEVFEIEITEDYHNNLGIYIYDYGKKKYLTEIEMIKLSLDDGFKYPKDFVDFFSKYKLYQPRHFYVYRWDWNE